MQIYNTYLDLFIQISKDVIIYGCNMYDIYNVEGKLILNETF